MVFNESELIKKFAILNSTQVSIETVSRWVLHYRKHYQSITHVWLTFFQKGCPKKKLLLMYLANDVIQRSRKKGPEFGQSFEKVLRKAFEKLSVPKSEESIINKMYRLLQVWEDRHVYPESVINRFRKGLELEDATPPLRPVNVQYPTIENSVAVHTKRQPIPYEPTSIVPGHKGFCQEKKKKVKSISLTSR